MRLDPLFESFYTLGSLFAGLVGPQVCSSSVRAASELAGVAQPFAQTTAFIDVNVVPMDTERVLSNQTVVVEGVQVTALGPTSEIKIPAGAVRIDGRGKYLMPGLADMHFGPTHGFWGIQSQAFIDKLFRNLAQGVTTIRGLAGSNIGALQEWRRNFATAEVPSQRMYIALGIKRKMKPDSAAAYIASAKAAGYDHIGTDYGLTGRTPEQRALFDSVVAAARRAGLPVSAHSHALPFEAALALGTTGGSAEHLFLLWDSLVGRPGPLTTVGIARSSKPVVLPMERVPALVAAVKRAGVWITPTLRCLERVHSNITGLPQLVKALHDADVGLLLGGDDGLSGVHHELAALVGAGLTPYQALRTGTRNVAEYFGRLDSSGTVATGKWADLLLLNGNPLADVRHVQEPAGVMINGRWFDRAALDRGLRSYMKSWLRGMTEATPAAALVDSLEGTKPSERHLYEPLMRRLAAELGTLRTTWTPEQRRYSDPYVRVWMREQGRQGYKVIVPGVTPVP